MTSIRRKEQLTSGLIKKAKKDNHADLLEFSKKILNFLDRNTIHPVKRTNRSTSLKAMEITLLLLAYIKIKKKFQQHYHSPK